ncbi:MAG: 2,3-bisphosphoglycerate-independent phosphoglycerate mutase [Archaeoglobaceae archaeon]
MDKKILMVIIDGLADRPIDGKTPLSSAKTPNMDKLASNGINGIMDTISPGIRPGSDTAHLTLLGFDPYQCYSGRGPIEATGAGIDILSGDVCFRVNFGTVEGEGSVFDKTVTDRRAGRISETDELVKAINENVELDVDFIFKRGTGHRGALVIRGEGLSDEITATDPKSIGKKVKKCKATRDKGEKTAQIVNSFMEQAHRILDQHPYNKEREKEGLMKGNVLLLRGVGLTPQVPSFEERFGMKLGVVAGTTLIKGVGKFLKGDVITPPGVTGGKDTDLSAKIEGCIEALETHDFVLLHIKATDEYGHDGDFEGKKAFVESVDHNIKPLMELDPQEVLLILTADHSTPIMVKEHTADPVPVIISHEGVRVDDVSAFSEFEAYKGGLCRIRGRDLVNISMDLIDKSQKFGA